MEELFKVLERKKKTHRNAEDPILFTNIHIKLRLILMLIYCFPLTPIILQLDLLALIFFPLHLHIQALRFHRPQVGKHCTVSHSPDTHICTSTESIKT